MEKKQSRFFSFKRLGKKGSWSSGFRWKRKFNLHLWFMDHVLFKIVSVFEAILLVLSLCFFYLCCGCHI